jgi:DNA mismatch repair protein MutL
MRHPYFHKAVMDAYERLVPEGEQISYFIYFEVDPANIDVNIHPTKTEIKFENEQAIWQILAATVKESLGKFNVVPSIDFDMEDMPDIPAYEGQTSQVAPPEVHVDRDYNPFKSSSAGQKYHSSSAVEWEGLYSGLTKASKMNEPQSEDVPDFEQTPAPVATTLYNNEPVAVVKGDQYLQFKGRFILTSVKSGLMLIDQHRAHVRVLFDRYLSQIERKQGVSQGVLFPEMLQLAPSEIPVLQSIQDDLYAVGFDLSDLGGGSYAINGIPAGIEGLQPVDLLRNMLHTAMEKGGDVKSEIQSLLALSLAQAAAIVYGQVLSNEEMATLIDNLFVSPSPNYTPDGKVILTTIKEEDIERLFK